MARKTMITKYCPKCKNKLAVASKKCKCGHTFFVTRRSTSSRRRSRSITPEVVDERRRTARVKRVKPNYYDSQEFEKKKKRGKKTRREALQTRVSRNVNVAIQEKSKEKETTAARAARRRQRKEEENGGGDLVAKLSPEKQRLANLILDDINRKLGSVIWKPV